MKQIERRWKYNAAAPDKTFMLSDLAVDNRWYKQRLEEFESKLTVATRFKTEEEFIGEEIQRIGNLFTRPVQVYSPGMRNLINYTEYIRKGYDWLSMGQDWPLHNIVESARSGHSPSIDQNRMAEFSEAVYDNLQDGVSWLMYENFLKQRMLAKLDNPPSQTKDKTHLTIFLSYSWVNQSWADIIEADLSQIGIRIIRDKNELGYKDSIEKFMAKIRDADFAILLLSDDYLRSKNCLHELFELLKEKEFDHRVLPILCDDCKFFTSLERLPLIRYWEQKRNELQEALQKVDTLSSPSLQEELRFITQVCLQLDLQLAKLADMNHLTVKQMRLENYRSLIQKIGGTEISHLYDLLEISLIADTRRKEIAIDDYFEKYPPNTYSYGIRAALAKELGNFERSKSNYERSIALDPSNATSLNNLGYLHLSVYQDKTTAKSYFEKALAADPSMVIAKLNLAVLLSSEGDEASAEKIYKDVLSAHPNEIKALNNLANIYNREKDYAQAKLLFERVLEINPDFFDSLMNLGSIEDVYYNNPEKALVYFQHAKNIAPNEGAKKFAEEMIGYIKRKRIGSTSPTVNKTPRNEPCPCGSGIKFKNCHGKS